MRILLVTTNDLLSAVFDKILNPENEYCAIVTDEPDLAKKSLPDLKNLFYSVYDLKECIKNFHYDVVIFFSDEKTQIYSNLKKYGVSQDKFISIYLVNGVDNFYLLERAMRYYEKHAAEFEIFATGISYIATCLDSTKFKRKLFNFGRGSQDLYYDYQIAKFVFKYPPPPGIRRYVAP